MSTRQKIVLITGATAGIGRITALHLAREGHHVIASGRKVAELAEAQQPRPARRKLDTLCSTSRRRLDRGGGRARSTRSPAATASTCSSTTPASASLGPTSEIGDAEMRRQYETNVFGLMNVTRAFLPKMRARRAGPHHQRVERRRPDHAAVLRRLQLDQVRGRVAVRCAALRAAAVRHRRLADRAGRHPHQLRGDRGVQPDARSQRRRTPSRVRQVRGDVEARPTGSRRTRS